MACFLCQIDKTGQRGGSYASDAVVNLITCETFDSMNATNQVGGDCGVVSVSTPMSSMSLSSVPNGLPSANHASINYAGVQSSVLSSLAAVTPAVTDSAYSLLFPENLQGVDVKMQFGGRKCAHRK
jgi:hypothetical protein